MKTRSVFECGSLLPLLTGPKPSAAPKAPEGWRTPKPGGFL